LNTRVQIAEPELVQQLQDRSRKAFDVLYDNYSAALYGVIQRMVMDEELSSDLLQEAFVKIWNNIGQYDSGKGRLFTWMMNLTRNLAIDRLRSRDYRNNQKNRSIDNVVSEVEGSLNTTFAIESIGLKKLVDGLKEEQRFIIELLYFKGYTQSEVAEEFGIPLGTVKTRVRMAVTELRKHFDIK
jgi:RNA polymerase sigma-70 factor (ECF subfamily)